MSGAITRSGKSAVRYVKPVLSHSEDEARRRVLHLYKAWMRQVPWIALRVFAPITEKMLRNTLREEFDKNRDVTDIRVIDRLVIKGQMELIEVNNGFQQKTHIMNRYRASEHPKRTDFLGKFYDGHVD